MVSVIVPNYNNAKYLKVRMESILSQTYRDFEIIIIDDCSTDNSREIIETYRSNPKVTGIIYNGKNSGSPFVQWEKGIALAGGDIVWIAENDDSCTPDLLEKLVHPLEENPGCVVSYCRSLLVDGEGKALGHHFLQENSLSDFEMDGKLFVAGHMSVGNHILNASAVLFRKSAAEGIRRDYRNFKYSGDIIFWSEISRRGTVHFCAEDLNLFRRHATSQIAKGKSSENIKMNIRENSRILDYFRESGDIGTPEYISRRVGKLCYSIDSFKERDVVDFAKSEYGWKYLWPLVLLKKAKDRLLHKRKEYVLNEISRP